MIRKTALVLLALMLMTISYSSLQVDSSSDTAVKLIPSITTSFPDSIDFSLDIETDILILDIRLHYVVERESFSDVTQEITVGVPMPFQYEMSVYWTWDMRTTGSLPSGTVVRYWWTAADIDNNLYRTEPASFSFDDDNYDWHNLNHNNVTLYRYYGDEGFAADLMQTCQDTLVRLGEDTGAYPESPIRIYIYSSSSALRNAMVFAKQWTGGVAYPAYGVIAIGISRSNLEWGKRALAHEIAHLVTHQMTSNPYNSIPVWLNEGISMYAEGELEKAYENYLKEAVVRGSLISVQSLCSPFSAYSDISYLSYAQSYSIVAFLIERYGQQKMHRLLMVFKDGSTYDNALLEVYGFDLAGLNSLWQDYIIGIYMP
ncbi:MAG: peptidase MA family metallohydrolase [Dehalococcoidales bacterium]|nr:peptidase MA family metallohydrolase [Dehalococcoidales bacterium]